MISGPTNFRHLEGASISASGQVVATGKLNKTWTNQIQPYFYF